jgi:hypothetical protein
MKFNHLQITKINLLLNKTPQKVNNLVPELTNIKEARGY